MAKRTQRKSKLSDTSTPAITSTKRIENSWVLLLKDSLFVNDNFCIITLPHPATGKPAKFCLDSAHQKIYEVVTFSESHRSWFIGETVKSDGSILLVTPINPLFLVLPRLKEQCSNRAMPIEDLISEKGFDKIVSFIDNLDVIGDVKGSPEMKAYKYNEEKTLTWLKSRVKKMAGVLRQKNIHVTSGAASATFVASNINSDSVDEEFFLKYAYGIVSEYLQDKIAELLEKEFDFKSDLIESIGNKRKSDNTLNNNPNKKVKSEPLNESAEDVLNNSNQSFSEKKPKPLTAKEKSRQKAASGTKTISSFFSKK